MVDLSDKVSDCEDTSLDKGSEGPQLRTCADCGTTKTPLWRGGPAGPKSLCNACGIKSRKKRRALLGLNKDDKKSKKSSEKSSESTSSSADSTSKYEGSLQNRLFGFGKNIAYLQRPRSNTHQRRKMGEEEQAAYLLMALSCGSVYA